MPIRLQRPINSVALGRRYHIQIKSLTEVRSRISLTHTTLCHSCRKIRHNTPLSEVGLYDGSRWYGSKKQPILLYCFSFVPLMNSLVLTAYGKKIQCISRLTSTAHSTLEHLLTRLRSQTGIDDAMRRGS